MEDPTSAAENTLIDATASGSRRLAQTVAEQRRQIKEFLTSQRNRMDGVELRIVESLGRIIDELVSQRSETAVSRRDLDERAESLEEESRQIARMRAELEAAQSEWEQSRRQAEQQQGLFLEQLRSELQNGHRGGASDRVDMTDNAEANIDAGVNNDYQKRYEMAMEDLHALREENQSLEAELGKLRARTPADADVSQSTAPLSWEAQKQRILASLEEDFNESEPENVTQRLGMEELVKTTESALAEKDTEIAELKQLLEKQSANIGEVAVGAAALGEIIDNDEIIQQQRKNLALLQEELQEKLRSAEIDISVERAKIARERADLEEKLRLLSRQTPAVAEDEDATSAREERSARGRWLSRLGLSDLDK